MVNMPMNPNNNTFRRDITNGATQAVKDALDDGFHLTSFTAPIGRPCMSPPRQTNPQS